MAANNNYDAIQSITPDKETWRIRGRIVYAWEQVYPSGGESNNLDFILMDSEGSKIQATIQKRLFWKFKSLVTEGEIRYLANFRVSQNIGEYRPTKHTYKIVFTSGTTFASSTNTIIPENCIEFASFKDITHNRLDTNYLIDIIGQLHGKSPLEEPNKKKKLRLELIDDENQKLICTLWESLAIDTFNILSKYDEDPTYHPIIIVRFAKIKPFKDSDVSNTICSRVMIDAEIPEVRDFIKRMGSGCRTSVTLTHLSSHSTQLRGELLEPNTRRTIDEIRESQEEGYYVTLATVKGFDTKYKWFIESCKTCKSNGSWMTKGNGFVMPNVKDMQNLWYSYKVRVNVVDHTGNATFILFDSQVSNLIQQSS
ncbi:replication protein A 70 kDa DNA-binding subunit B-like [Silene latifolia]|uniref:replication protein A 70 kDa DNA-binding subunit B-like n=1 Tax=Silene latifolia TaxID=37657 RepID=UPI003D786943